MRNFLKEKNKLRKKNRKLIYDGKDMLGVLKEIDYILCSLNDIGSYYANKNLYNDAVNDDFEKEIAHFVCESYITVRLARIRKILTEKFDTKVGKDEMDDLERECQDISYWKEPGDFTTKMWLE